MMNYKSVIKLVFGLRSSVGLCMKDYKFLLIAVMISGTLHRHSDRHTDC